MYIVFIVQLFIYVVCTYNYIIQKHLRQNIDAKGC